MKGRKITKKEVEVLYQLDSGVFDPARIAEILPDLNLKKVKETLAALKKHGFIKTEDKKPVITKKGRESLDSRHKWIFG